MTLKKYLRLCVVLLMPLLISGVAAKIYFDRHEFNVHIVCKSEFPRCTSLKNSKYKDKGIESVYLALKEKDLFYIFPQRILKKNQFYEVYTTEILLRNAQFLDLELFTDMVDSEPQILAAKSIIGRTGHIFLGFKNIVTVIDDRLLYLNCFDMNFNKEPNEYRSLCEGDGWRAKVTYRVSDTTLDDLTDAIKKEINSRESDYLVYKILMYPLFIYIFLFLSLLVYITSKAIAFVKNG